MEFRLLQTGKFRDGRPFPFQFLPVPFGLGRHAGGTGKTEKGEVALHGSHVAQAGHEENAGRYLPHVHVLDAAFLKRFPGHPFRHVHRFPELFRQAHQKGLIGGFQFGFIFGTAVLAPGIEDNGPQAAGGVIVKVQGKGLTAYGLPGFKHAVESGACEEGIRGRTFKLLAPPQGFQHLVLVHSHLQPLIESGKKRGTRESEESSNIG